VSTLHLILPPLPRFDDAADWRRWLARGDRLPDAPPGRSAVLRALFRFPGTAWPAAALRRRAHAGDAHLGAWLCADPSFVRGEATGARLMVSPLDDLSREEADGLARALRTLFGDAGAPLEIDTPSGWCVRVAEGAPLPAFVEPDQALGADLLQCLPAGDRGRPWRRLFNEAQVILHAHPVNAARVAAGRLPVNALWFWGAGRLPGAVQTALQRAAGSDGVLRGLCACADVPCDSEAAQAIDGGEGEVLADFASTDPAIIADEWLPRCQRALGQRRFGQVEFAFVSGERFRLRPWHRWRFWRKPGRGVARRA